MQDIISKYQIGLENLDDGVLVDLSNDNIVLLDEHINRVFAELISESLLSKDAEPMKAAMFIFLLGACGFQK
jgi:hypothetical protein